MLTMKEEQDRKMSCSKGGGGKKDEDRLILKCDAFPTRTCRGGWGIKWDRDAVPGGGKRDAFPKLNKGADGANEERDAVREDSEGLSGRESGNGARNGRQNLKEFEARKSKVVYLANPMVSYPWNHNYSRLGNFYP